MSYEVPANALAANVNSNPHDIAEACRRAVAAELIMHIAEIKTMMHQSHGEREVDIALGLEMAVDHLRRRLIELTAAG